MSYNGYGSFFLKSVLFSLLFGAFTMLPLLAQDEMPFIKEAVINSNSVFPLAPDVAAGKTIYPQRLTIGPRENNISFELSHGEGFEFRYFLKGYDHEWTSWKSVSIKEYTHLAPGKYLFRVIYRDRKGKTGELTSVSLRVLPNWYFSYPAFLFYLIMVIVILSLLFDHFRLRYAEREFSLEQIISKRTEDLIIEKEKTEALLANVFPKNTADELMEKGKATKIKYNFVTVLFSDIQGFTKIAEETNPEILIDELDTFFFHFDSVVEKFGIEKIKTIGDAYMCAGGIPEKNRTNPIEVVLAALEMMSYMKKVKESSDLQGIGNWDIRIGIHTGTVVAGVVGQKKLSYDIWGDTVNTASRMESSGDGGKINISGTTREFVKDFFICRYRGRMPVKYKGELEMYFVEGIVPALRNEEGGPNEKFILKMQKIKLQDIEEAIIKLFDEEAPPNLYFHNSNLLKSLCNQVELLSTAEGIDEVDFINLKLASVFLISGYIYDYEKPMEESIHLVEEYLPRNGFNSNNIDSVCTIIKNLYSGNQVTLSDRILHDARYDYLGRVDYLILTGRLLREKTEYGSHPEKEKWIEEQRLLLADHDFLTNSARLMRSVSLADQTDGLKALAE